MPVIGRLDDQVEAVLINPLKGRGVPEEAERERPATPLPGPEERDGASPPPAAEREADAALPVWLL